MPITVEFAADHEFSCELTKEEKALVDKIKQANAEGKTSFSNDELSKEDVQMLRGLMEKDVKAFSEESKASFNKFSKSANKEVDQFMQKANDEFDAFKDSFNMDMSSDFMDVSFSAEEKKETKKVMIEQRKKHDVDLEFASELANSGNWVEMTVEKPIEHNRNSQPVYYTQMDKAEVKDSQPVYYTQMDKAEVKDSKPVYYTGGARTNDELPVAEVHNAREDEPMRTHEALSNKKDKPKVQPSVMMINKLRGLGR